MKGKFRRIISAGVLLVMLVMMCAVAGCGTGDSNGDLMAEYGRKAGENSGQELSDGMESGNVMASKGAESFYTDGAIALSDFGVRLLNQCYEEGKNTLISPVSVASALAMTANGAKDETLTQMENVLGMEASALNIFLKDYQEGLPNGDKYKMNLANGIWFKDGPDFVVNEEFLQANADYYDAGLYKAPFDNTTKNEINAWVDENTDGMIKEILDEIPEDAVMYLVNALAFDGEWKKTYSSNQVQNCEFTKEDGSVQDIEMMYSTESRYLEDEKVCGFLKYYADEKYAFVGLLPKEGITVEEYLGTLDGEGLQKLLDNPLTVKVNAGIPKFKSEYSVEMKTVLQKLGMMNAFDEQLADFSGIGHSPVGNLFINRVLHKTYIAVDEQGTKAAAVSSVEVNLESAALKPEEIKTVILNRPFVYLIIDCENQVPLFLGTAVDMR